MRSVTKGIADGDTIFVPLERIKNIGKTPKSSVPVLSAFADGLRSPSAKEKVDTREWKVDFLDQRVLVLYFLLSTFYFPLSTFYFLLSTLCEACGVAFRVAHPKSSRFSSRAGSAKYWGFAWLGLEPIHAVGGGRIRTICVIS